MAYRSPYYPPEADRGQFDVALAVFWNQCILGHVLETGEDVLVGAVLESEGDWLDSVN